MDLELKLLVNSELALAVNRLVAKYNSSSSFSLQLNGHIDVNISSAFIVQLNRPISMDFN